MKIKNNLHFLGRTLLFTLPLALILLLGAWYPAPEQTATDQAQIAIDTFDQQKTIAALREQIKGKENLPSDSVFQNIKIMNKFPAGRLLGIMEVGFSKSLGVTCEHCHVPDAWAKEDKPEKQIARDMWAMTGKINNELLKNIPNLQSKNPAVNCTTCHRGHIKPATSLQ